MPLQQPANYGADIPAIPDPTEAVRRNLEFATGFIGAQQKSQLFGYQAAEAQLQLQQAQNQVALQQQMRQDMAKLAQNPTPEAISRMTVLYPQLSEQFKRSHGMLSEDEQKARVSQGLQIYNALASGAPDVALNKVNEFATANANSNRPQDAQALRSLGDVIQNNPNGAQTAVGMHLASVAPSGFAESAKTLSTLPAAQAKAAADAGAAQGSAPYAGPQAAATLASTQAGTAGTQQQTAERAALLPGQLAIQKSAVAKSAAEVEEIRNKLVALPPDVQKEANGYINDAQASQVMATRASNIADNMDKIAAKGGITASGAGASAAETIKRFFGSEDNYSAIRQQFNQFQNSAVLQQLKGSGVGRITEKEIALIQSGFPAPTANPALISQALRLQAKVLNGQAGIDKAKAQWMGGNRGSLLPATRAFSIGGRAVQIGDSLDSIINGPVQTPAAPTAPQPTIASNNQLASMSTGMDNDQLASRIAQKRAQRGAQK
jgi:hypothetical protein